MPLFKRMEEKYHQEVEMPELEKRKRELANRRNMYAFRVPIEEIQEHGHVHDEILKENKRMKHQNHNSSGYSLQTGGSYHNKLIDKVID